MSEYDMGVQLPLCFFSYGTEILFVQLAELT